MVWCGVAWRGVSWHGMAWYGMAWHDIPYLARGAWHLQIYRFLEKLLRQSPSGPP